MNYVYLKIPRFDGRKTIAFNGLVFIAASGGLAWSHTGGSPLPVSDTALYLLAAVAAVNGILRLVTERPVWWRQVQWYGLDMAEGESETVYHKAAELAPIRDHADFQRDLDRQLCDTREKFSAPVKPDGTTDWCQISRRKPISHDWLNDELAELPLDADSERG